MISPHPSRRIPCAVLACAAVFTQTGSAQAGQSPAWDFSGSVGVVTDYVDRGVSQSDGHMAVHGGVLWQHAGGLHAGVAASSVDFDDGHQAFAEISYLIGIEQELSQGRLGLTAAYVDFPGAPSRLKYDLVEFATYFAWPAGPLDLRYDAIFSPQEAGNAGKALYMKFGVTRQLTTTLSVGAHVGRQWIEREEIGGPDYSDWALGLEWRRQRVNAAVRFFDTAGMTDCENLCGARIDASVGLAF